MKSEVKILIEGMTNADSVAENGEERTRPTVSLVRDKDLVMVVDPGVLENQQILIDALKKEGLTVDDVNVVCITHSHIDHYRNIGMFPTAKTLEYYGMWDKTAVKTWVKNISENVQVLHTPGHDFTGITVFADTEDGIVAICGDIFWKENYPRDPHNDAFASNPDRLKESRAMILKMADWIVPGHGPMYKNDRSRAPTQDFDNDSKMKQEEVKITVACKKCGRPMAQKDKCLCRPYLCFKCCECGFDCPDCGCSSKG